VAECYATNYVGYATPKAHMRKDVQFAYDHAADVAAGDEGRICPDDLAIGASAVHETGWSGARF